MKHSHTHTHTQRKPWRKLALFLSFFIPLIGFLACKNDSFYEPTIDGTATEKVDFNTLPNQEQKAIYKRSYILAIQKYNAVALTRNSESFYTKYGQTDMLNSKFLNFDMENPKFIFVIPFKNQDLQNNLVLIGYFEGHKIIYRFYDKTKIAEYHTESNYPYFIDHLDAIFYIITNQSVTSRDSCDYLYSDGDGCFTTYCSDCYGCYTIDFCSNDKGEGEDGDWDWNGSEWELPGVEVEAEGNEEDPWDYDPVDYEDIEYPYDEDVNPYEEDETSGEYDPESEGSTSPVVIAPNIPINDVSDFIRCFDISQPAQLTIYVDQPVPNSTIVVSAHSVGHAFIGISQGANNSTFGFYPNAYTSPFHTEAPPIFGDDSSHSYDVSLTININPTELESILNLAIDFTDDYDLNDNNCTDFTIQVANLGGLNIDDCNSSWGLGSGSNPAKLGQTIRNLNPLPSGAVRNTTGGTPPSNHRGC